MATAAFIDLDGIHADGIKAPVEPIVMPGIRLEHLRLKTNDPYEFESGGVSHYVALHDLALHDGELRVDGLPPIRGTDLRNTLTYVPKGRAISGWARPIDRSNSFTILQFDPSVISDDLSARYVAAAPLPLLYARDRALLQSMAKLRQVAESGKPDPLYVEALSLSVALEIFGASENSRSARLTAHQIRRLTDFIEAELGGSLSLDALAEVAGLSRSHFSRTFTTTFGRGPYQYTQERRIARAEYLLRHTIKDSDEIATLTGFASLASFRRAFKQVTGQTPARYRRDK